MMQNGIDSFHQSFAMLGGQMRAFDDDINNDDKSHHEQQGVSTTTNNKRRLMKRSKNADNNITTSLRDLLKSSDHLRDSMHSITFSDHIRDCITQQQQEEQDGDDDNDNMSTTSEESDIDIDSFDFSRHDRTLSSSSHRDIRTLSMIMNESSHHNRVLSMMKDLEPESFQPPASSMDNKNKQEITSSSSSSSSTSNDLFGDIRKCFAAAASSSGANKNSKNNTSKSIHNPFAASSSKHSSHQRMIPHCDAVESSDTLPEGHVLAKFFDCPSDDDDDDDDEEEQDDSLLLAKKLEMALDLLPIKKSNKVLETTNPVPFKFQQPFKLPQPKQESLEGAATNNNNETIIIPNNNNSQNNNVVVPTTNISQQQFPSRRHSMQGPFMTPPPTVSSIDQFNHRRRRASVSDMKQRQQQRTPPPYATNANKVVSAAQNVRNFKFHLRTLEKCVQLSTKSQEKLYDWDEKIMGLKKNHSVTMRATRKSRKQLLRSLRKEMKTIKCS